MFPATVRESLDHTARMKLLHTFTLVVLVEFLAGCAAPKARTQTDAPDGFYIEATGTLAGYASEVLPPGGGRALSFRIQDYVGFVPRHFVVFDTPDGYTVQISGRATVEKWWEQGIIIVANHKPYFELSKSGQAASRNRVGPSATISLVLRTREEADAVASALRRRYSEARINRKWPAGCRRYLACVRRWTLWMAAWSVHLMSISSMQTCGGRLAAQTNASAMSSAASGMTPS